MQTVNFRCGHCTNLMAVSSEFLGQQVRCPHCQNVVVTPTSVGPAPAPAAPPPAKPEDSPFRGLSESEDIFGQPQPTDSLFDEPEGSRLELPPAPTLPDPILAPYSAPAPAPEFVPPISLEPTLLQQPTPFQEAYNPTVTHPPGQDALTASTDGLPWMNTPADNGQTVAAEQGEPLVLATKKPREPIPAKVNWFIPLVFMPLLLYALLATAAIAYLYLLRVTAPPSLFDRMPDVDGDTPGVKPVAPKANLSFDRKFATQPLPKHLHMDLKSTLTIGDIEVTPTRLERKHVAVFTEGAEEKAEPGPYESLVLHLKLKNLAKDYAFTPLDNYFDRKWSPREGGTPPLTMLEAGSTTFFGGPTRWYPLRRDRARGQRRDWLEGGGRKNVDREGLAPGATMNTFICTDGWDPAIQLYLFGLDDSGKATGKPYVGPLLWRVRLRRGLVTWKGKQVPATAVIGVDFTDKDIPKTRARPPEDGT